MSPQLPKRARVLYGLFPGLFSNAQQGLLLYNKAKSSCHLVGYQFRAPGCGRNFCFVHIRCSKYHVIGTVQVYAESAQMCFGCMLSICPHYRYFSISNSAFDPEVELVWLV